MSEELDAELMAHYADRTTSWEYGIRYDRVPLLPGKDSTHVMWLPNLNSARQALANKIPMSGSNHTVVHRLVGPVEPYPSQE